MKFKLLATFALLAVTASSTCFANDEIQIPRFSNVTFTCHVKDIGIVDLDENREHCENIFKKIKGMYGGYDARYLKLGNVVGVYKGMFSGSINVWITYEVIKK